MYMQLLIVFSMFFFCEECELWDLVLDTLSESDSSLSLSVVTGFGMITFKKQSLHVSVGM